MPTEFVESITKKLYKHIKRDPSKAKVGKEKPTTVGFDCAMECGKFTSRPSDITSIPPPPNSLLHGS
jgi:hypothetical protein